MPSKIYKTFAKIFALVLLLAGGGAVFGGQYAKSFIADQLGAQNITMPTAEALSAQVESGRISKEDSAALLSYAGEQMTTGAQAAAFADHYIAAHMAASAAELGYEDATFATLGQVYNEKVESLTSELKAATPTVPEEQLKLLANAEIQNPLTEYDTAKQAKAIEDLRYSVFLDGNTLRGMLLNAYGWGMIANIALYGGAALLISAVGLGIYGFTPTKKNQKLQ